MKYFSTPTRHLRKVRRDIIWSPPHYSFITHFMTSRYFTRLWLTKREIYPNKLCIMTENFFIFRSHEWRCFFVLDKREVTGRFNKISQRDFDLFQFLFFSVLTNFIQEIFSLKTRGSVNANRRKFPNHPFVV